MTDLRQPPETRPVAVSPPPTPPEPLPVIGEDPASSTPADVDEYDAPRRSMGSRHVASLIASLLLTPIGVFLFDLGSGRFYQVRAVQLDETLPVAELVVAGIGLLVLLVVVLLARMSGLGPLVAGLVWGWLPVVWVILDLRGFFSAVADLPTVWDYQGWLAYPYQLFPLVGLALVGAGLVGRWRAPRTR